MTFLLGLLFIYLLLIFLGIYLEKIEFKSDDGLALLLLCITLTTVILLILFGLLSLFL